VAPFSSSADILDAAGDSFIATPSCRTIRRVLQKKLNLPARRPAHKPLINAQQRLRRIQFCKKYLNWTREQWGTVLFSDESTFQLWCASPRYVRRPVGKSFDPKFTLPTIKKYEYLMVWGCFGKRGRGRLHFIPKGTTVNAEKYVEILREKLRPALEAQGASVFQQDNAPCHAARLAKAFFQENGIEVLEWPGNSPDLNPIENLWHIMKKKVSAKHPRTVDALKHAILEVWVKEVNPETCQKLVYSMPDRLRAVLKNNGFMTKY
jgi:transposase